MTRAVTDTGIEAILSRAIAAELLPPKAKRAAEHLLERFNTPTRVALLGRPLSGKARVFNLLANANILQPNGNLGTIKLEYGEAERTTFQFADGTSEAQDGLPGDGPGEANPPVLTRIEAPLPALRKISLLQIGNATDPQALESAMKWAVGQTDIAIWCTHDFSGGEKQLWSTVPEAVTDHAILVRTNWDSQLEDRVALEDALRADASDLFAHALAMSSAEAQAARSGGEVDKDRLRASGATKLISTVLKDLERGRQSLVDMAELILAQNKIEPASLMADDADMIEAVSDAPTEQVPDVDVPLAENPTATSETSATAPAEKSAPGDVVVLFRSAADRLQAVGQDLIAGGTEPDPEEVLATSADTLIWLDDFLGETESNHPALEDMRTLTQGANDIVQLLRLEGDQASSIDAAVLLLQLRRSLLSQVAA